MTLTATVTSAAGVPAGTVTFLDGATVIGTGTLSATGTATLTTSALAAGSHPLTASFGGSATFAASTSAVVTQVVNPAAPGQATSTTSLTATPNPVKAAAFLTLTATVTPVGATGVPTGKVNFMDGTTILKTVTLNNLGQATLITRALQVLGAHNITAVYVGDATFLGSGSPVVIVTVN